MRVVIQRVSRASVRIGREVCGAIDQGLLVLVGIEEADTHDDVEWLVRKILPMRLFPDESGRMNRSLVDVGGQILLISQFTLHASSKKGNRPSFTRAAAPAIAVPLYESMIECFQAQLGASIETGRFGAEMHVELCNSGPVTIIMDSKARE